jgi:TrmH family RNA methyltransferase
MYEYISSPSNPKVKNLIKLGKGRGKDRKDFFVFEGVKEIELAMEANIDIQTVFFCKDIIEDAVFSSIVHRIDKRKIFEISRDIFAKIAYRDTTGGILVVAKPQYMTLNEVELSDNPLVLVLESVEKPGNLGGILRTADAAAVDAVIVCDPLTDLYNPNIIRSSLGTVFSVQIVACRSDEAIQWLRKEQIKILVTDLNTVENYHQVDFSIPCALVMGTEHDGISTKWLDVADQKIKIPMLGKIDSLNVSTSTAILAYEARKQKIK